MRRTGVTTLLALLLGASPAWAQQRPLVTEDPEPIGAGRVLIEGALEFANNQQYPASGLEGDLWRLPTLGLSVGISSIAEFQLDGTLFATLGIDRVDPNAPLASHLTVDGNRTSDVEDLVVATKIRLVPEAARRPALALRVATKLPNAGNESGLGLDTTDFFAALLAAKTIQSVRLVGNLGLGILADPTDGARQNDVLTYGVSFARALTDRSEVVGELNGRISTRSGDPFPGTESLGRLALGGRYTWTTIRLDLGLFFGLTSLDPSVGVSAGMTYVFRGFDIP